MLTDVAAPKFLAHLTSLYTSRDVEILLQVDLPSAYSLFQPPFCLFPFPVHVELPLHLPQLTFPSLSPGGSSLMF